MRRSIYSLLHRLAWWASSHRVDWLWRIIYRYCCPYPISSGHYSARGCYRTGDCGCSNAKRFAAPYSCKSD